LTDTELDDPDAVSSPVERRRLREYSAIGVLYARSALAYGHDMVTSGDGRPDGLQKQAD
jgi:hypothetical protein